MDKPELAPFVFIGTKGILICYLEDYPQYGCIPLIGVNSADRFAADINNAYYEEDI